MDPAKLKVVELRAELSARGLDHKGVKAVLVERLKQALEEESGEAIPDSSILETSTEETSFADLEEKSVPDQEQKSYSEFEKEPDQEEIQATDYFQEQEAVHPEQGLKHPEQGLDNLEPELEHPEQGLEQPEQGLEHPEELEHPEQGLEHHKQGVEQLPKQGLEQLPEQEAEPSSESHSETPLPSQDLITSEPTFGGEAIVDQEERLTNSDPQTEQTEVAEDKAMEAVTVKTEQLGEDYKENYEDGPPADDYQGYDVKKEKEAFEADVKMEEQSVEVKDENQEDRKRKRSRWSPKPKGQGWGTGGSGWTRKDDEPDLDENAVVLGWYDSDLNLEISKTDFLEGSPMSNQGFGYIWAGCRATFGFNKGRICYEVKLLENHDVSHLEDEPSPHVLRVGWSTLSSSMLLGEEPFSYGYGGTGKASTNCKFTNYGTTFVVGDTVTAYLDYGEQVKISFSVNGQYLRDAFTVPAFMLENQPLFPHILSKNIKFRANFGQNETEFPIEPDYTWASQVPEDQRVAGPRRPENRGDCEMLMMCGLPGCGKTTWANKYVKENPEKYYNILGTNNLIDKMKIQGLPRKRNYHGRWDVLIDKCTKCLNKLLDMAGKRRRNYILDQTNVYPSAQKRKMRSFGGFIRRAIVIVPTDEEFQRRCAKREAEEGKDIPDSAVLEMKANFRLPEQGEHFDEVRYIELNEEESRPLVEQYNKEGRAAGFGQAPPFSGQGKKFRPNDRQPFRGGGGGGGGFRGGRGGGGFGGGMDRRDRSNDRGPSGGRGGGFRSGPPMKGGMDRGGRGGWQPRGGMDRGPRGGWRDRSPPGGFDRDGDNRGPGGGPWRNNRSNERDRPYDRSPRGPGGRGGRAGGFERDNSRNDDFEGGGGGGGRGGRGGRGGGFRDMGGDYNRGGGGRGGGGRGGGGGGFDRDDFSSRGGRGGFNNSRDGGGYDNRDNSFREGGGGGGRGGRGGGRGGFDRDQQGGGGRGGFDRNRGGGGGGFNERRGGGGGGGGGGNRDGGFDRNRGGPDRGQRDNKGGNNNSNNQGNNQGQGQGQGWGNNQGYNSGWGQQGYNQGGGAGGGAGGGYNQGGGAAGGYSQGGAASGGFNQGAVAPGYNQQGYCQQPNQQAGWGQQTNWANKGYTAATGQQQTPAATPTATPAAATPAATGYNTAGYTQQAGYNQQYAQNYWGQYGYGQGWTQNTDGTYSYPQGWQQYGYNYAQNPAAMATQGTVATPAATPAAPQGATK